MRDDQITQNPWWKTTATVVSSILGFIGLIVGLAPLVSAGARQWYKDQWFLGWMTAAVIFLVGSVIFVILRNQQASSVPLVKPVTRIRECESDVALIDLWIGPFMRGGESRIKLEQIPHHKLFSRHLSFAMEKVSRDLNDSSKEIFDKKLRLAMAEMKNSFETYWGTFENYLDGPGEMMKDPWDLTIIQPPGGNWSGTTTDQQCESFYRLVRSLAPLKHEFLDKVDAVEKVTHRLRIEADLPVRT